MHGEPRSPRPGDPGTVRVLWLIKGLGPGGAERLLVEHARASRHDDITYDVAYLLPEKRQLVPELEALGVRTYCLDVTTELDVRWIVRLRTLVNERSYDVVHAHSPLSAAIGRVALRTLRHASRPPMVYTEHNNWSAYSATTRAANSLTYPLSEHTLAVSEDARMSVAPHLRGSVEALIHGIDLDAVRTGLADRDEVRARLGVTPHQPLVATVANFREGKGYPDLLAAARLVLRANPAVRFVAAGQGQLESEIRALHARLGLGDRFQILGYVEHASDIIAASDVFALASHQEGLPVAVMEALALGVPVVAPAVGGLRQAVTTGENGILCAARSPESLAAAIEQALHPEKLQELRAGALRSSDRFSSREAVARIEAIYTELAHGPRRLD